MQETTAQDRIQALITQYKDGTKKPSESDNIVIRMLEPLVTKKYADDPKKRLEAIIVDLSAILKIKYTQTVTKKTFTKKATTIFTPDVLGGNVTPGIHGDIETLVAELRQHLSEITQRAAAPVKNNDAELAEARKQAAEAAAELAAVKRRAAETEAALAAEKIKAQTQQSVVNSQADAALAEARRQAEALAAERKKGKEERERLRTERRAAKEEAKAEKAKAEAKALEAQQAQAQLQTKDAEVKAANDTAAKSTAKLAEYEAGEEQRKQQYTIDGATQVIRRVAEVVGTNEIMLLAITQGFGGMQEFTTALITGNTKPASGNGQIANSNHSQPVGAATPVAAPNGNHRRMMSEAEEQKYKDNLGETGFTIILRLITLHSTAKTKNERLMIQYLITQLAFAMDKSVQSIATETSALLHRKKHFLAKDYPDFNALLKSLSEDPQNESKLRGTLTQDLCRFMVKRLGGKPENGVLLLPTDEAGVKLFTQCYKILGSDKKIIPPNVINTYEDTILGNMELPKPASPIHTRKENAGNAGAASAYTLSELRANH